MRVVITGGAGFVGANLARELLSRGADVVVIDDLSSGFRENLNGLDVEFIEASILENASLEPITNADAVVHLAAQVSVPHSVAEPGLTNEVNITGTLRRGRLAHRERQSPGHAYAAVVPAFVDAAVRGEPLQIHGDGLQTRDFTYVGTIVETLCDAIERRVTSLEPVNLAFGTRYSLLEVAELMEAGLGHAVERNYVGVREGDVRDSQADSTKLTLLFPEVQPDELAEGLRETISWMKKRNQESGVRNG